MEINQKGKGIMENKKIYLEIALEKDKRDVAAILVANGYNVGMETVFLNGKARGKKVLAFWKEEKNG